MYSGKKMEVICKIHNHKWKPRPIDLVNGQGCPKCRYAKSGKKLVLKIPEFIKRSRETHGDKYDYSKVHQFKRQKTETVVIICPNHGEFKQKPYDHYSGSGCTKCWEEIRSEVLTIPWEDILKSFRETHGEQYEYNSDDQALIILRKSLINKLLGLKEVHIFKIDNKFSSTVKPLNIDDSCGRYPIPFLARICIGKWLILDLLSKMSPLSQFIKPAII